ncbi:MAG: methionyl-tRNA formyltransferase [Leptospiraceae bacterium]|nr:methionyl-tRNA formyltransferase [Leptospiraceae bacterium]MCP5511784.1 methionyl-tRNA formyltransferase [Leptospiraceae bacterium]
MKLGYFGTPIHSAYLLERLYKEGFEIQFVVTNPDKPSGRGGKLTPSPTRLKAEELGIPVYHESLKSDSANEFLSRFEPDLCIVFAYGALISEQIFSKPPLGTINLHGSLLPEYRGASPVQAAILDGKTISGITLQYITKELDAGDIISKIEISIEPEDNFGTLLQKMTEKGTDELIRLIKTQPGFRFPAVPQDHSKATFCKKIHSDDRKLNFSNSAEELQNRIRAFNPGNICFTSFREKRLNVYKTRILDSETGGEAGTYFQVDKRTPGIVTSDKKILVLEEIQPENKKRISGSDFINGFRPQNGEYFQ